MKISVIIPTYNEEKYVGKLIQYLNGLPSKGCEIEIMVVDGMSRDATPGLVKRSNALLLQSAVRSRAAQLNLGAAGATGDIFYFLHADTWPPKSLYVDITDAINLGFDAGCYHLSFDQRHWFLRLNAWFSKFNVDAFRYGDQSLFVSREAFQQVTGYDNNLQILEDNEIVTRLKKKFRFKLMSKAVVTSARKYRKYGIFRLQFSYYLIYLIYRLGASQQFLLKIYRFLVRSSEPACTTPSPDK